jgi:hypothetical protein
MSLGIFPVSHIQLTPVFALWMPQKSLGLFVMSGCTWDMAEVHGNRTHLRACHPYTGFEVGTYIRNYSCFANLSQIRRYVLPAKDFRSTHVSSRDVRFWLWERGVKHRDKHSKTQSGARRTTHFIPNTFFPKSRISHSQ